MLTGAWCCERGLGALEGERGGKGGRVRVDGDTLKVVGADVMVRGSKGQGNNPPTPSEQHKVPASRKASFRVLAWSFTFRI